MNNNLDIPCGYSIPRGNPHAVSVSFPTLEDVIRYEEQDETILSIMQSGYPRFFQNRFVRTVTEAILKHQGLGKDKVFVPIANEAYSNTILSIVQQDIPILRQGSITGFILERTSPVLPVLQKVLQNTGFILSSRAAEDFLYAEGVNNSLFTEDTLPQSDCEQVIRGKLQKAYNVSDVNSIVLTNTGMSAVYHVFNSIKTSVNSVDKQIFLQLGWLYLDTMDILSKYGKSKLFLNIDNLEATVSYIKTNHQKIAAVFTEYPTNPLLHKADLTGLYKLLQSYNIPLIVDCSLGTAFTYGVLEQCDVVIESLTKFASGNADVMMGAIIFSNSTIAMQLKEQVGNTIPLPYHRDLSRLALEMQTYTKRVEKSCANSQLLLEYLEASPAIAHVFSAKQTCLFENQLYPAPVISIEFTKPFQVIYDRLKFAKGPSFGTSFTLAMPYVYLAHYGLIKSVRGKRILKAAGLSPDLLRLSVGTEPIDELVTVFDTALS